MSKYALHGKFTATEGKADELGEILIKASRLISNAKGCQLYVIGRDKHEANAVWVTEIWDSSDDHRNSLNLPGIQDLISEAKPLLSGSPQKGQELEILGGWGLK